MDEEQKSNIDPIAEILQRPKQKINVDSFFNRSDDAESITAISLKLASVIEQIDVMRTEIKDIATYITVEHKIEKDLREDRLFEEQDAKQKKEMRDRALARGEQVPKTAKGEAPQEESKGGGFFSGLMKIVGGLGLVAGLAALAPIILKVMGGLLITTVAVAIAKPLFNWVKGTFDKFKNFLDKTFKPVEKIPVVGKPLKNVLVGGLTGGLPGIAIAAATSISNALQGAGKGNDSSGFTGTSGPTSGGNMNLEENNAEKDMADTLKEKGVIKDTRNFGDNYKEQEEFFASDEYKQSFDKEVEEVEDVDDKEDKKKLKVTKEKRAGTEEEKRRFYEKLIESGEKDLLTEKNERKIQFAKKKIHKGKIGLRDMGDERYEYYQTNVSQEERIDESKVIIESGAVTPISSSESFTIERIRTEILNNDVSMNNTSVVVPKNEPQVSSAEIKGTGTTLAYVRSLQNPYLSITNKKIAPELSRIG